MKIFTYNIEQYNALVDKETKKKKSYALLTLELNKSDEVTYKAFTFNLKKYMLNKNRKKKSFFKNNPKMFYILEHTASRWIVSWQNDDISK